MLFFCYNILHFLIFSPEKQYVFNQNGIENYILS